VKTLKVVSSKEYENNTRTTYLVLSEKVSQEYVDIITTEISAQKEVKLFSYYDKTDYSKCMFTVDKSLTESMVVDLINQVIEEHGENSQRDERDFSNRGYINNYHITRFTLDTVVGEELLSEIVAILKESEIISDVEYKGNSQFEVTSLKLIYPIDVEYLLLELDIKILKEEIK
jgi:hypothetical protein